VTRESSANIFVPPSHIAERPADPKALDANDGTSDMQMYQPKLDEI